MMENTTSSDGRKMNDEEYNEWFLRGYASFTSGDEIPGDATKAQISAWRDGLNSATEENEGEDYP